MISVQTREVKVKHTLPTIRRIPYKLWDLFKKILPKEKPPKTGGKPIVPYRKVLDGILSVLRTGCQWKMLPKEYGSGSVCHRRFQEWNKLDLFIRMDGSNCWEHMMIEPVSTRPGNLSIPYQ
jgi:transposase